MSSTSHDLTPTKLLFGFAGWPPAVPTYFRWSAGSLIYFLPDSNDLASCNKFVIPMRSQWEDVWCVCDEIDVWSWPKLVGEILIDDGLQYTLKLEVGSRAVESSGQVCGSPKGFYEKLMKLHRALQQLVGWQATDVP